MSEKSAMSVLETTMEKQLTLEGSNYHIRETYLQAMKQFMANGRDASQSQLNGDIEKYFRYEKWVSYYIQNFLGHSVTTTAHR
jgi:hypothetical protein